MKKYRSIVELTALFALSTLMACGPEQNFSEVPSEENKHVQVYTDSDGNKIGDSTTESDAFELFEMRKAEIGATWSCFVHCTDGTSCSQSGDQCQPECVCSPSAWCGCF